MTGSERRYMVYGIGNGIVDQQVKITDSELEDLRLSKGFMELADQAEQARILAYLGNREERAACWWLGSEHDGWHGPDGGDRRLYLLVGCR